MALIVSERDLLPVVLRATNPSETMKATKLAACVGANYATKNRGLLLSHPGSGAMKSPVLR
jgi:hypothetical protein